MPRTRRGPGSRSSNVSPCRATTVCAFWIPPQHTVWSGVDGAVRMMRLGRRKDAMSPRPHCSRSALRAGSSTGKTGGTKLKTLRGAMCVPALRARKNRRWHQISYKVRLPDRGPSFRLPASVHMAWQFASGVLLTAPALSMSDSQSEWHGSRQYLHPGQGMRMAADFTWHCFIWKGRLA